MNPQPLKIAILAMGGEGGGVLADWIVEMAEMNGYLAQTTSVPGVAQRTGATIYYLELFPAAAAQGRMPVLALMPLPGDVDVVLASELMEAGRAVQRGLVSSERTTFIASTHRVYSMTEKMAMGDGRVDAAKLLAGVEQAAARAICFDMAQAAEEAESLISAVLFGALCGCGALPFERAQFEDTIRRAGLGVDASLRAFAMGLERSQAGAARGAGPRRGQQPAPRAPEVRVLLERIAREFPVDAQDLLIEGVRRLIDYQDPDYAGLYLDRLTALARLSSDAQLLRETARHMALWMAYEDTIRVADLKVRTSRFERVRAEVRADARQLLAINEFMHPRLEEICDTLPAPLGRWLMKPNWAQWLVRRFTRSGRVVRTTSLGGFLMLYTLSRLRRWRRGTLRYPVEQARIEGWLARVLAAAGDPRLALEIVQCQRLVKGYGDTHARGLGNFLTLMGVVDGQGAQLPPLTLKELRDAALADEHGRALKDALARHALV